MGWAELATRGAAGRAGEPSQLGRARPGRATPAGRACPGPDRWPAKPALPHAALSEPKGAGRARAPPAALPSPLAAPKHASAPRQPCHRPADRPRNFSLGPSHVSPRRNVYWV
ncbi:hypothetical protein Amsp01_065960 [Amycolatopsis sp. NBRC 101858]|nr:hypothetical protein Amsp01_065960 [Amycolatopsis sp. NBRC 101858]